MVKVKEPEIKSKKTHDYVMLKESKPKIKKTHDLEKLENIISHYTIIDNKSILQKLFDDTIELEVSPLIGMSNYTTSVFNIKNVKLMKDIDNVLNNFFLDQKPIQNIENPYIFESRGEIVYISKYIFKNSDKECFLAIKVLSKKDKDTSHFFIVKF